MAFRGDEKVELQQKFNACRTVPVCRQNPPTR